MKLMGALCILFVFRFQYVNASVGFKWNTNVTVDAAFLTANPGPYDSLVIYWTGSGAKPTLTIDLAGGTLPMVFRTGYIKAFAGAKLIIKNCKIEGAHARKLWQGIILWNSSTGAQNTSLEMENCTLNYAWDGVFAGTNMNPSGPIPSNGALVTVKNSKFYNCRTGVTFAPYTGSNVSRVEKNKFFWDKYFDTSYYVKPGMNDFVYGNNATTMDSQQFRAHIIVSGNHDIALVGNECKLYRRWQEWGTVSAGGFIEQRVQSARRKGLGILLVNSGALIGSAGPCYQTSGLELGCYNCYGANSIFEGLYAGVCIANTQTLNYDE